MERSLKIWTFWEQPGILQMEKMYVWKILNHVVFDLKKSRLNIKQLVRKKHVKF